MSIEMIDPSICGRAKLAYKEYLWAMQYNDPPPELPRYLYRSMRRDNQDLEPPPWTTLHYKYGLDPHYMSMSVKNPRFKDLVVQSLNKGSHVGWTSPLWH